MKNKHTGKCYDRREEFEKFLADNLFKGQFKCLGIENSIREDLCNWINYNEEVFIDFVMVKFFANI